jgi:hypothetical protein
MSILHNATYISVVIENQFEELQWETYLKKFRQEFGKENRLRRQLSNYMLFDLLGFGCIVFSIAYFLIFDTTAPSFNPAIISDLGQVILKGTFLLYLWFFIFIFLKKWTDQMAECYGPKSQTEIKKKIKRIITQKKNIPTRKF